MTPTKPTLPMREYRIRVLTNPPLYMVKLGLDKPTVKWITVQGYTLKDAMRRAGVE